MKTTKRITPKTDLSPEREAWLALGRELGFAPGIDPSRTSTQIAKELVAALGDRKAAWTRTRINQLLEARTGVRSPSAGRGRDKLS